MTSSASSQRKKAMLLGAIAPTVSWLMVILPDQINTVASGGKKYINGIAASLNSVPYR